MEQPERRHTIDEAARLLGTSTQTVRRECARHRLRYLKIGHRYYIPASAIAEYLERATVPANPEPPRAA